MSPLTELRLDERDHVRLGFGESVMLSYAEQTIFPLQLEGRDLQSRLDSGLQFWAVAESEEWHFSF